MAEAEAVRQQERWRKEIRAVLDTIPDLDCSDALRVHAANKLWPFTWGDGSDFRCKVIMELNGAERLTPVVWDDNAPAEVRGRICNTYQNLACNGDYRTRLVAAGAAAALVKVFCTLPPERGPAWGALGNIIGHDVSGPGAPKAHPVAKPHGVVYELFYLSLEGADGVCLPQTYCPSW